MFARLGTVLHIPLTLMLVGIVLRGSAFTFRTYDDERDAAQRRWGRIFAGASLVTPVLLGICVGAIAAGRVGPLRPGATFTQAFVEPWLTPFSVAVGVLALALFAHLAAVFLTLETDDRRAGRGLPRPRALVRRRRVRRGLRRPGARLRARPARGRRPDRLDAGRCRFIWPPAPRPSEYWRRSGGGATIWREWRSARRSRSSSGDGRSAQYPYLVPPDLTVAGAAAPAVTLRLVLIVLALGAVVLLPSLVYLFRVFKAVPSHSGAAAAHGGPRS